MKRFTSLLIATLVALTAFAQTGCPAEGFLRKSGLMRKALTTALPTAKGERTARPAKAPAVVVAPAGLVAEEYSIVSAGYDDEEQTGSVYVGFDGQDVYIQGLCSYLPEAWVKGQLDGTTATFAADQYLGSFSGYDFFFQDEEATFEYDAKAGRFSTDELVYTYFDNYYADYYDHPVLTKVVEKAAMPANPSVIGLEEDEDYGYYIHFNVPAMDTEGNGLVASKLSYQFFTDVDGVVEPLVFTPATHVKLTENLSVIPFGFTEGYDFYSTAIYLNDLYSASWDRLGIKSIYTGGGETHETEIQWIDLASDDQGGEGDETGVVVAPEDLATEAYLLMGYDAYNEEDVQRTVQVGFYGEDEVYIQGLSEYIADAWVKGTLKDGVLSIPDTYLGSFAFLFDEYELSMTATEFQFDSENNRFVSEEGFYTTDGEYAFDDLQNVVLQKMNEMEATPADPEVVDFVLYDRDEEGNLCYYDYPHVRFRIPALDTEGRPMLTDKQSYTIWVEAQNGDIAPLVLTTDLYTELPEDFTEIPYNFTDEYDIMTGGAILYLNQDVEKIITWKKIGVQSIYRGMGVEHRSNIGWFDIEAYIQEVLSAVGSVASDEAVVRYFDLQGRVARADAKGLLIKQVRDSQGNVRNVKVIRK